MKHGASANSKLALDESVKDITNTSPDPVAFHFGSEHYAAMNAARERINLALKVLSSRHNPEQHVTASDVYTLKSCVRGDMTGRSVYEMATAVIRAELDREQHEIQREISRETARANEGVITDRPMKIGFASNRN